ncbi:hypothetical protein N431DRAFT_437045 [Stipitochalara longipes BDJ]|nr:hypothetical protein N431DRAFT_437045 [Stipitochalara longipes BDJ]
MRAHVSVGSRERSGVVTAPGRRAGQALNGGYRLTARICGGFGLQRKKVIDGDGTWDMGHGAWGLGPRTWHIKHGQGQRRGHGHHRVAVRCLTLGNTRRAANAESKTSPAARMPYRDRELQAARFSQIQGAKSQGPSLAQEIRVPACQSESSGTA